MTSQRTLPTERLRGRKAVANRARFLSANPLCVHCLATGHYTVAREVDHIIGLGIGGPDLDTNKQALCIDCHRVKSAIERGARNYERPRVGLDGYPIQKPTYTINLATPDGLRPSAIPLTILFGPPAAGKTTLGNKIAEETGAFVIDLDNFFKAGAKTLPEAMTMRNRVLESLSTRTEGSAVLLVGAAAATERTWWRKTLKPQTTILVMCSKETSMQRSQSRDPKKRLRTIQGLAAWWSKYTRDDTVIHRTD